MSIHRVAGIVACAFAVLIAPPLAARVTRIVIDEVKPVPEAGAGGLASERIAGFPGTTGLPMMSARTDA